MTDRARAANMDAFCDMCRKEKAYFRLRGIRKGRIENETTHTGISY